MFANYGKIFLFFPFGRPKSSYQFNSDIKNGSPMSQRLQQSYENIIVKMPNWLGDLVMATPILADLRKANPDSKITAMCTSILAPLLQEDPSIDEIYAYKRPSGWIHRRQHLEIIEAIDAGRYDLGILLTNSFSSAWWFWRGNVKKRIGFGGNFRSWLLSDAVAFPKNKATQHLVNTYKELLSPLGIPISSTKPSLYVSEKEIASAKSLFIPNVNNEKIILGINPGAAYGSAKCWLPERFVEVTRKMLENPDLLVVYFGDSAGAPLVNSICDELPSERVINLAGKTTLRELVALIKCCSLVLTNDSGPMHIAAALNIPLVALFGSTNDITTGPYGGGTVIHKHVECSPCYKRVCPIDFKCMKKIEVDEVFNKLNSLVKVKEQQGGQK